MTCHDVFNGDADGLCALHQLRLAVPRDGALVTGPKRDVRLLERVAARAGDSVTVLDISLDANRAALTELLARDVDVAWFDHHYAGEVPVHPRLSATIDTAPDVCTSMLVDRHIAGRFRPWAVVAAYGDNLRASARQLAATLALGAAATTALRRLGEALAYAGCGEREADLLVAPAELYRILHRYADPLRFAAAEPVVRALSDGARGDLAAARVVAPAATRGRADVYELPDAAWSRRIASRFDNDLANRAPARAHVVLTPGCRGEWWVSVRAPLASPEGADRLCRQFPGGGGREAAAGINALPASRLPEFMDALAAAFPARPRDRA
jgi:hypothetical protein